MTVRLQRNLMRSGCASFLHTIKRERNTNPNYVNSNKLIGT